MDAFLLDGDKPALIQIADGFLKSFLGDLETVVDQFCRRLIAEVAITVDDL